jgi:hypothetical protein
MDLDRPPIMAGDDKRVVWILGAGFSVPLGGPLFKDLISWQTLDAYVGLTDQLGGADCMDWGDAVVFIYRAGLAPHRQWWRDAEQFLDVLDVLRRPDPGTLAFRIQNEMSKIADEGKFPDHGQEYAVKIDVRSILTNLDFKRLRLEAIRFVAGACSHFLIAADATKDSKLEYVRTSEVWEPYIRWSGMLQRGDTVITFNYDRVLRVLELASKFPDLVNPLKFFLPLKHDAKFPEDGRWVTQCPLHGHLYWELGPDGDVIQRDDNVALKDHALQSRAIVALGAQHDMDSHVRPGADRVEDPALGHVVGRRKSVADEPNGVRALDGFHRSVPLVLE